MFGSTVALVGGQSVTGENLVPLDHGLIASDFGQDRCGGNGKAERIPVNQAALRQVKVNANGVDEKIIAWNVQLDNGATHSQPAGLQDVMVVDLKSIGGADRCGQSAFL